MQADNVIPLPKFKIAKVPVSSFVAGNTERNEAWAREDLEKSGLDPEFVYAETSGSLRMWSTASAVYSLPYFFPDGQPILDPKTGIPFMWRSRMKLPYFSKENRYDQPNGDQLAKMGLPAFMPYIHPLSLSLPGELICAEGEKKAASIIRNLGLPAFGIGGCQLWRHPDGSGSLHPWILDLLRRRGGDSLTIIPDGDVMRYDICRAYGAFARACEVSGIQVRILQPPDKIDDLIVKWAGDATENFNKLETIQPEDLVQSPSSLAVRYSLAFKEGKDKLKIPYQHTSNVMRLLEEHPAFPRLWKNLDTNRVMVGEEQAEPGLTEMDLANYFQHNLGFDKVNAKMMFTCVDALAKRNCKSPFLDYIRGLEWDGTKRLDTWMMDHWGVPESPFVKEVSAKFLISACSRMDKPGTKIDWMLIVVGPQGTGKTSMPAVLFDGQNLTLYGEHQDKDLHMLMHSALCVGFDELDSFGKRESSNLKAMITRNEDAFRPPYGASVEVFPRRFTLYGCGNRYEFLQHDPSGYRRYAVVEVDRLLDFKSLSDARDQLWAEAWARYQDGVEEFWTVTDASGQAQKYAITNPMEDKIQEFFAVESVKHSGGGEIWFKMTDLLEYLGFKATSAGMATRDVAGILHAMGIKKPEKVTRHPSRGVGRWYVYKSGL